MIPTSAQIVTLMNQRGSLTPMEIGNYFELGGPWLALVLAILSDLVAAEEFAIDPIFANGAVANIYYVPRF
jgi:hypothetical protein